MSGRDLLGVVHFGVNAEARDAEIRSIILEHVGQALALIVIGVALAYLIGRYLSRSIGALATVAREIGQGNLDVIDQLVADNFVDHEEIPGVSQDKAGIRQWPSMVRTAFLTSRWCMKTSWPRERRSSFEPE